MMLMMLDSMVGFVGWARVLVSKDYADWIAFGLAILVSNFASRAYFLAIVKHSKVENVDTLPDNESARALLACQALRVVLQERRFPYCGTACGFCDKMRLCRWYGPHIMMMLVMNVMQSFHANGIFLLTSTMKS